MTMPTDAGGGGGGGQRSSSNEPEIMSYNWMGGGASGIPSSGLIDVDEHMPNSLRSAVSEGRRNGGGGLIPLQPGEIEASKFERPTSAPPPGFDTSSGADERNRLAEEMIWGAMGGAGGGGGGTNNHNHHGGYGGGGSGLTDFHTLRAALPGGGGGGGSSQPAHFSSLAAVLGTDLAGSVGASSNPDNDAVQSINSSTGSISAHDPIAAASLYALRDDLNFHRQTRHVALRLGGQQQHQQQQHQQQSAQQQHNKSDANAPAPTSVFHSVSDSGAGGNSGFPSSLSTPVRSASASPADHNNSGNEAGQQRRGAPMPNNIGMKVVEPNDGSADLQSPYRNAGIVSHRLDNNNNNNVSSTANNSSQEQNSKGNFGHQFRSGSEFDHMWSPNAKEFKPKSQQMQQQQQQQVINPHRQMQHSGHHVVIDNTDAGSEAANSFISGVTGDSMGANTEVSAHQAENELRPFMWDPAVERSRPSRTLAIMRVSWLRPPEVRSACEAYGVVENFRSDFAAKGIFFVSYYDIRSAQYAAIELQPVLQRMLILQRSNDEAIVRYCLPLNSSSQFDESQISITEVPPEVHETYLGQILQSLGAVRSLIRQGTPGSYTVEFHNIQDAKQALLELDSTQPWGPGVLCEMGARNPMERKRGRELLSIIARWRQSMQGGVGGGQSASSRSDMYGSGGSADLWRNADCASGLSGMMGGGQVDFGGYGSGGRQGGVGGNAQPQLVLGPDGRYQIVMQSTPAFGVQGLDQRQIPQQQIVQGPNGQLFVAALPVQPGSGGNAAYLPQQAALRLAQANFPGAAVAGNPAAFPSVADLRRAGIPTNTPYYTHIVPASDASVHSARSYRSERSNNEDKDNRHLMLDLDGVEHGTDPRTSLMVRNIPNKYTQQMLLSEFEENGHGPGVIDFFYLPIDFKNRCNRGYAFINFVDYRDILPFHRRYFGKHWRTFNSDKICDITYARIQGKAAMLKRFENSALMEKDEEYKPLVFVSDGPNKGQRLPFPGPSAKG